MQPLAIPRQGKRQPLQGGRRPVLVLTRKGNQSIMIGEKMQSAVMAIMGEKVRIGIQAPRSIPVFRKEVYVDIQRDRAAEAAGTAPAVEESVDEALAKLKDG